MDSFLSVQPGLLFWSIINFLFFLVVLYFIGGKNFIKNINDRENLIHNALRSAEENKAKMENIVKEHEQKMLDSQNLIDDAIKKAKEQSELQAQLIISEAKKQKETIINDAAVEIERSKKAALQEIRAEVVDMVMTATEKIILERIDQEKDKQLINEYLKEISKN